MHNSFQIEKIWNSREAPWPFLLSIFLSITWKHSKSVDWHKNWSMVSALRAEIMNFAKKIIHKHLETKTTNLLDLTHRSHIPHRYWTRQWYTCLTAYTDETSTFLKVRHEFCREEYERMIIDILSTRKILKRCRTDFPIPLNKKKLLIEKSRVMKILITMSAVSGYMVKNENGYLLSSVVTEPCFFNK